MKPPLHSPSPDDAEQPLLQAARDMRQPEPGPALDAAILAAAARRAGEIRKDRAEAATSTAPLIKAPKKHSALERFSRWLLGDGQTRGHLGQAVAASVFIGVALGLVLQVERDNSLSPALSESDAVAMKTPSPEAAPPIAAPEPEDAMRQARAFSELSSRSADASPAEPMPALRAQEATHLARDRNAEMESAARISSLMAARTPENPPVFETEAQAAASAASPEAPPPAPPPSSRALAKAEAPQAPASPAAMQEESRLSQASNLPSAASPKPAPPPLAQDVAVPAGRYSRSLDEKERMGKAAPAPAASIDAAVEREQARSREADPKAEEIDTQLKRILDLRRAGKEEEAELLLRELRARYPEVKIDERLRQLETFKNN